MQVFFRVEYQGLDDNLLYILIITFQSLPHGCQLLPSMSSEPDGTDLETE